MQIDEVLDSKQDLELALGVAAEVNRVLAAADVKAGLVLAGQAPLLAGFVAGMLRVPANPGGIVGVAGVGLAGSAAVLLLLSLWPRTGGANGVGSWVVVPNRPAASKGGPRPPVAELVAQAWRQAGSLSVIAQRKYLWFRAATVVSAAEVALFVLWLPLSALGGS